MIRSCGAAVACAVLLLPAFAGAQGYPTKPIRVVLPVPAGGTPDVLARAVTPAMSAALGQQLVIDNRGGAGGRIAAETVAGAAPDGYTLFMSSPPCLTILPHLAKVPYDTLRDFAPVSLIATGPMLLLTVQGRMPGDTVDVTPGTRVRVSAEALGHPAQVPLPAGLAPAPRN